MRSPVAGEGKRLALALVGSEDAYLICTPVQLQAVFERLSLACQASLTASVTLSQVDHESGYTFDCWPMSARRLPK